MASRASRPSRPIAVTRTTLVVAIAAIVVAVALGYAGHLGSGFILDDEVSVVHNRSIRQLATCLSPPADSTVGGRPIANLTFAWDYAIGGLNPAAFRATNLVIHVLSALLLFDLLRRTWRRLAAHETTTAELWAAALAALAWAVHPVQTNAVSYVAQRTELLMALCYLLMLDGFVRGIERRGWLIVSAVACACGMASKEVMVTAPVLVLLYDRAVVARSFAEIWRARRGYYLALMACWLLLGSLLHGLSQRSVGFGLGVTPWTYLLTESRAVATYLARAAWPHPLVFDYGPQFLSSLSAALPYAAVVIAALAGVVSLWRRSPAAGLAAGAFFLILAPTSTVVPVALQPIAESRMYLPLAGLCAFGVFAMMRVAGIRALAAVAAALPALLLLTQARNTTLRDPIALWSDTLRHVQNNARAHANLGAAYYGANRNDEAILHEREALRLDPGSRALSVNHVNLAAALLNAGQPQEALEHALTALAIRASTPLAHYQAGNALVRLGRTAEALPHFEAELQISPDYPAAHANLGAALFLLGRPADSISHFEEALRLQPDYLDAVSNLGSALLATGHAPEAVERYRQAVRLDPGNANRHASLAGALINAGRLEEARAEARAALQLQPTLKSGQDALRYLDSLGH